LGCKLNQAEVEALQRRAASRGWTLASSPAEANWALVNTCAVTHTAEQKSRQAIRRLQRLNPAIRIALTGCYATLSPDVLQGLPGVELVLDNAGKASALDAIARYAAPVLAPASAPRLTAHTRALVKIQDGCDNRCSYCTVCLARGPQRSTAPEKVLAEVRERLAEGYREVVLTGVHIGAYGRDAQPGDADGWSLARLVNHLLKKTDGARLRLSSIEPWDVTDELLALWPNPRLCRHLHVPIQSGSDAVLARMQRHYTASYLREMAARIRLLVPGMALTSDLICGFPGESEADHQATLELISGTELARVHVFTYSARPGTPAARMPESVPEPVAQARSQELIALGRQFSEHFTESLVGQMAEVLFESRTPALTGDFWSGLTDNYVRVYTTSDVPLRNVTAQVRCEDIQQGRLMGVLL